MNEYTHLLLHEARQRDWERARVQHDLVRLSTRRRIIVNVAIIARLRSMITRERSTHERRYRRDAGGDCRDGRALI